MTAAALERRAEIAKLARLLELDPGALEYLEAAEPAEIARYREQATDLLYDADRVRLKRMADASRLLPVQVLAAIGRNGRSARCCARASPGLLDPRRAIEIAEHLPSPFLAELGAEMDPRRATEVISGMPADQVAEVAAEMARRGEHVAMGRFVAHLSDPALAACVEVVGDADLLRIGAGAGRQGAARADRRAALRGAPRRARPGRRRRGPVARAAQAEPAPARGRALPAGACWCSRRSTMRRSPPSRRRWRPRGWSTPCGRWSPAWTSPRASASPSSRRSSAGRVARRARGGDRGRGGPRAGAARSRARRGRGARPRARGGDQRRRPPPAPRALPGATGLARRHPRARAGRRGGRPRAGRRALRRGRPRDGDRRRRRPGASSRSSTSAQPCRSPRRSTGRAAGGMPEVFTTAHDALFTQAGLRAGERLLVHGARRRRRDRRGAARRRRRRAR